MRYGSPSVEQAVEGLGAAGVDRIVVLPLFPQYSSASAGSALEKVMKVASGANHVPQIRTVSPFYEHPAFISAFGEIATPLLRDFAADHVLLSYHGLPERQVRAADPSGSHCLASSACCDSIGAANRDCYRAQCFATSRALAAALELSESDYTVSFQSRLGRGEWIRPYTDVLLGELARRGVRRLAVACPAFVADCLETLEELGIRGREQWREAGGEDFLLLPCPNAHPSWVRGVAEIVRAES
jgi:ferrochelatase